MRTGLTALTLAVAILGPASPAAAEDPLRPKGDESPLRAEKLSDEFKLTRFAHALYRARIRTEPRIGTRVIKRLRYQTEDGLPEPYLVLRSRLDAKERVWLQIRVPGRPNGRKGWVERSALSEFHIVETHLRINRKTYRATLYKRGEKIWSAPIGHGAPGTPTPSGRYIVRERLRALGGIYGPWAFGTSAYSILSDWPGGGVVGVHGTNQPSLIPGRPSHGCVRVPNPKIRQLARLMPVGTPLQIV